MSNDFWSIEDVEFLTHLYEIANDHRAEITSPLMALEDRAEQEEALNTAMLAIEAFESCKTEFIQNLEKSLDKD
jgi:transposase-like protein